MVDLSQDIIDALNEQIKREYQASSNYLAAAAWCNAKGYDNSADFFTKQSDEERVHMLKIFHYICDMGGMPAVPAIIGGRANFNSLKEAFEMALESEKMVTAAIDHIVEVARNQKDFRTENFMQWFVQEQIEEEFVARRAVELFDLMGEDKLAIFMIDERIPKISYTNPEAGTTTA